MKHTLSKYVRLLYTRTDGGMYGNAGSGPAHPAGYSPAADLDVTAAGYPSLPTPWTPDNLKERLEVICNSYLSKHYSKFDTTPLAPAYMSIQSWQRVAENPQSPTAQSRRIWHCSFDPSTGRPDVRSPGRAICPRRNFNGSLNIS